MFRVITRNSVYTVRATGNGFHVKRTADMWGREVKVSHSHNTSTLRITIGEPMATDYFVTESPVVSVVPA